LLGPIIISPPCVIKAQDNYILLMVCSKTHLKDGDLKTQPKQSSPQVSYEALRQEESPPSILNCFNLSQCVVQSSDLIEMTTGSTGVTLQEENVGFDGQEDPILTIPNDLSRIQVDQSQNVTLGNFLKRPVQIATQTWSVGSTLDQLTDNFDPWHLYFNQAAIKRKLDNYYLVRCNLHLKFMVNASPFFYGCTLASYQPLTNFAPGFSPTGTAGEEKTAYSQRPHIWIYPQDSQGGEMVLPFLYYKNWLDATSSVDLTNMGTISFQSFGSLANANGATGDIEIVVYAWADNIEVAGPTVSLAVQSKDEYQDDGVVSKPASAIARATSMLSSVPVIGPFATATSHAAEAVSKIASLFGYTNTPVIDDIHQFQPAPFPNLASTDIGMPIDKLTLDAKNELSIDPSIAGSTTDDELIISNFCAREAWFFENTWSSADTINTSLFYAKVSPALYTRDTSGPTPILWNTPMSHVSDMFEYWRGDIIFRFKFICSKYHRGRVRINWDPHGDIGTIGDYTTETYTKIVDITTETDVEFRVPYTQALAYLRILPGKDKHFAAASTSTADVGINHNGIITVRVLNRQTSPITSADIRMLVFARGADNLEFAVPKEIDTSYSPYAVQSYDSRMDIDNTVHEMGVKPSVADPNINLTYFGESIVSLRQLMRRQSLYKRLVAAAGSSINTIYLTTFKLARLPLYPGFDTNGVDLATGVISSLPERYNYTNWLPTTWVGQCFVGVRGSVLYSVNANGQQDCKTVICAREYGLHSNSNAASSQSFAGNGALKQSIQTSHLAGNSGMTMTNQVTQAGITTMLPMYANVKFIMNSPDTRSVGSSDDDSLNDAMRVQTLYQTQTSSFNDTFVDLYCAAGTDMSFVFFINVPAVYIYNTVPTPLP